VTDAESAPGIASWVGRVIDERYRIDRLLGEGGMGAVFVAQHLKLEKPVALKVILPQLAGDLELAQRFARESMVSAKLDHPHIASAIDCGSLPEGGAYLVMQLARGRALRAWMHGRADFRAAVQLGMQIADALAVAHAHGIVHRDLKPDNVIVEEREGTLHARVLDFGIARLVDGSKGASTLTRAGTIMGTPGYMAPEQAVGDVVDARADVYALGVILWELVSGRTLYEQKDLGAITTAQLTTSPAPLDLTLGVPPELDALVARMLDSSKPKRPANGGEVRDALRTIAAQQGLVSSSGSAPTPPGGSAAPREAAPSVHAFASSATERVAPTSALASSVTLSRPMLSRPMLVAGLASAGLLTFVALSCIVVRSACSGEDPQVPMATGAVVPPSPPPVPAPAAIDGIPPALAADFAVVSTSADEATRSAAVARLGPHESELPAYARMLVAYAMGEDCEDRRDAVRGLRVLRDPRALPALQAIAEPPRRADRCLRRDLARTIETLEGSED
jgi:eukaryotic-like serine/threonine-protein kinase